MHVLMSGYSVRLLYFVQTNILCMYGCMYLLATLVLVYCICGCNGDVCSAVTTRVL